MEEALREADASAEAIESSAAKFKNAIPVDVRQVARHLGLTVVEQRLADAS